MVFLNGCKKFSIAKAVAHRKPLLLALLINTASATTEQNYLLSVGNDLVDVFLKYMQKNISGAPAPLVVFCVLAPIISLVCFAKSTSTPLIYNILSSLALFSITPGVKAMFSIFPIISIPGMLVAATVCITSQMFIYTTAIMGRIKEHRDPLMQSILSLMTNALAILVTCLGLYPTVFKIENEQLHVFIAQYFIYFLVLLASLGIARFSRSQISNTDTYLAIGAPIVAVIFPSIGYLILLLKQDPAARARMFFWMATLLGMRLAIFIGSFIIFTALCPFLNDRSPKPFQLLMLCLALLSTEPLPFFVGRNYFSYLYRNEDDNKLFMHILGLARS